METDVCMCVCVSLCDGVRIAVRDDGDVCEISATIIVLILRLSNLFIED